MRGGGWGGIVSGSGGSGALFLLFLVIGEGCPSAALACCRVVYEVGVGGGGIVGMSSEEDGVFADGGRETA